MIFYSTICFLKVIFSVFKRLKFLISLFFVLSPKNGEDHVSGRPPLVNRAAFRLVFLTHLITKLFNGNAILLGELLAL